MYNEENNTLIVGLIKGRHPLPVDEYIFDEAIADVHDYEAIAKAIKDFIKNRVGVGTCVGQALDSNDYTDIQLFCGMKKLVVYVTGLTPVTVELVKWCAYNGITLTLMNFDIVTNSYKAQEVF